MYIIPFTSPGVNLANSGGKGANLARLARAGFNVPPGFILSTAAYQDFVGENHLGRVIDISLRDLQPDPARLDVASTVIRESFRGASLPHAIESELLEAYAEHSSLPVAVRSSATAEDLPDLSFAGQQETFLNISGEQYLTRAVIECWGSLWTPRAIGYRLRNDIPVQDVSLAVVVQQMVMSEVSGVLFTANPLTGRLDESVIDATFGLGEALVSGQVEPDHFVVNSASGILKSSHLGAKQVSTRARAGGGVETIAQESSGQQTLTPEQVGELAQAGAAIQREYGAPQDIEWAYSGGALHILQARGITSLFPVPEISFDPLVVWFSFGSVQGLNGPQTPLGQDAIHNVMAGGAVLFGAKPDPARIKVFAVSGERIWIRISDVMRNPLGHRVAGSLINFIEPSAGRILSELEGDPRIGSAQGRLTLKTVAGLARFASSVLVKLARNMLHPDDARARFDRLIESKLAQARIPPAADRFGRLANTVAFMRAQIATAFGTIMPYFISTFGPSMGSLGILTRFAGDQALALQVTRSLPDNVTSEMGLTLWYTSRRIRNDPAAANAIQRGEPERLAQAYLQGALPEIAQTAIGEFMAQYGMRGVGEIDFGQPRWREDPTPVMQTLQSYLGTDPAHSPEILFAAGEKAALEAIEQIAGQARAEHGGWLKEKIVRAAARRVRLLMGVRESPKFFIVRIMGIGRKALLEAGEEFAQAGTIRQADDLVFLSMDELDRLARKDEPQGGWQALIASRRANYEREKRRRQAPRVLASDGSAYYEGLGAEADADGVINGSPVSPGLAEGPVRVVFDPHGTKLNPGEVLVCPGTDPAWTPLFMVASALITEVGGVMTHGSVVAREYGIPAVVGVHEATTRLKNGQRVRVDGSAGKIFLLEESE